jgi:hypothetical protein
VKSVTAAKGRVGDGDFVNVESDDLHVSEGGRIGEAARGSMPLKPGNIRGVPRDVISGGPLHYALTADGRFQLYAVGWNGTDDGGSVVWKDKAETQIDFSKGDWVWPQPRE